MKVKVTGQSLWSHKENVAKMVGLCSHEGFLVKSTLVPCFQCGIVYIYHKFAQLL